MIRLRSPSYGVFADDARGWQCPFVWCLPPQGFLQRGVRALSCIGEKEMATHSSVLAWRIPGTVEPGGLPSMGSHIDANFYNQTGLMDWQIKIEELEESDQGFELAEVGRGGGSRQKG